MLKIMFFIRPKYCITLISCLASELSYRASPKGEFMLRKSPTRTEAFLAANRRNALKSTGPRTAQGKARSCMNNLKHGRYAKRLPEKLAAAGDHGGAALYQKVRGEIGKTFQAEPGEPRETRQLERITATVWCVARRAGIDGLKPRSSIFSKKIGPSHGSPCVSILRIRIADQRQRVGIVYWVQRKRYWTAERARQAALNLHPAGAPTLGEALESKLRHRVFRPGSPVIQSGQTGGNGDGTRMPVGSESASSSHENATPSQIGGSTKLDPAKLDALVSILGLLARLFRDET